MKVISKKRISMRTMERIQKKDISTFASSALLGRALNDIELKNAPDKLYVAGPMQLPLPHPRVAMVGSREANAQGLADAESIAKSLIQDDVVIVSGLARGIDSAAHKTAINSGGHTIAVLGTPLDKSYPHENAQLQSEIIKHHLAISQFEVGSVVSPSNFVRRNLMMALIADASVIVQAGEGSGSLSQGYETLRLGRPLFIWKSLFDSASLSWPREMAKYGAMRLADPKELLENLPSKKKVSLR
jgi:DNA processing protein